MTTPPDPRPDLPEAAPPPSDTAPGRVLVTGATGFVGRGLCRALVAAGYDVVGLARRVPRESDTVPGVRYIAGDVSDRASLHDENFAGVHHIVHCVGIIAEDHGRGQTFGAVHVGGTENVLRAARGAADARRVEGGRFVYLSAIGAAPAAPALYSRTKAAAEELVKADGARAYTIFRPSVILGPGAEFLRQMEGLVLRPPLTPFALPFVPVPGNGRNRFQPVDLEDLAACVVRCLSDPTTAGCTYEIGGADRVTFDELLWGIAARAAGGRAAKKPLLHVPIPLLWAAASVLEALLPRPPVTTDQLANLRRDNICDLGSLRDAFGIEPRGIDAALDRAYDRAT